MPQTKPLTWIKFMITMNLIMLIIITKMFQMMDNKNKITKSKIKYIQNKW